MADKIRKLGENGVEIGNHSHSHPDMKKLSSEGLEVELKISEEIFNKELGYATKIFAYPGGKYNNKAIEALKNNGYELAFTIDEGTVVKGEDPLKLKRIGIGGNISMFEFRITLTRAFNWYQFFRKLFKQ